MRLSVYLLPVVAVVVTTRIRARQVVQVVAVAKTSIILQKQVLPAKVMLVAYQIVIGTAVAAVAEVHQPPVKTVDQMLVLL